MRQNVGRIACNATNGVYVGVIVDVIQYEAKGQASSWVYVVERDGRRLNMPPGNTITVTGVCKDGQPKTPTSQPRASSVSVGVIPRELEPVATEFRRRLVAFGGRLTRLTADATITAEWTSQKCDMLEGEIVDFLISLHRGHPVAVSQDIEARRVCGGVTRTFRASASMFQQYRTGKISDGVMLQGLR
jgi:hypothetical protein